jgi:hypothetical protein
MKEEEDMFILFGIEGIPIFQCKQSNWNER